MPPLPLNSCMNWVIISSFWTLHPILFLSWIMAITIRVFMGFSVKHSEQRLAWEDLTHLAIIICVSYHFPFFSPLPLSPALSSFSYLSVLETGHWILAVRNSLKINFSSELISRHIYLLVTWVGFKPSGLYQSIWCPSNWNYTATAYKQNVITSAGIWTWL